MEKEWAELNKEMQTLLGKEATYKEGVQKLLVLREELLNRIGQMVNGFPEEAFWKMPFAGAKGYHSKTLSYSIWHIFRIEDIVAHEMIAGDEEILFSKGFQNRIHSPIITTGNEVKDSELLELSKALDVTALYEYAKAVTESSNEIIKGLEYKDLKRKFGDADKEKLRQTACVSTEDSASWLIDYWCGKDVRGLLKMPFSRHWIMHIEAMQKIKNKLCKDARKGVDPVAYCGFSCNHCFLGQWCGSCRTQYNACSFATVFADKKCPNVVCCQERGLDGCYECEELQSCEKGFYTKENEGAIDAKTRALFISKYGKTIYLKVLAKLQESPEFSADQEKIGKEIDSGLEILEKVLASL